MSSDSSGFGSFRDPSGFVFRSDGQVLRQVNTSYRQDLDRLMSSSLYEELVRDRLLIAHEDDQTPAPIPAIAYRIIRPEPVQFISYPYEWCFSELKDAALLTLDVAVRALRKGLILKDASAYNIQFHLGRPILIDTLSFMTYTEGQPWLAYQQFCRHFLAPLALMSKVDVRLGHHLRAHIDGFPLDLASRMLPVSTRFSPSLMLHLHLHAASVRRLGAGTHKVKTRAPALSKRSLEALIEGLRTAVDSLRWSPDRNGWGRYYDEGESYSAEALEHKREIVSGMLAKISPATAWDLGANTGMFSRLAAKQGAWTVAVDADPACVEASYLALKGAQEDHLLPLIMDLTNPSPSLGWAHAERQSLESRGPATVVLALALLHHLVVGNNLPFSQVARFLARICQSLIIEYVPRDDPQTSRMIAARNTIHDGYDEAGFRKAFEVHFEVVERVAVRDSGRVLYRLHRNS